MDALGRCGKVRRPRAGMSGKPAPIVLLCGLNALACDGDLGGHDAHNVGEHSAIPTYGEPAANSPLPCAGDG